MTCARCGDRGYLVGRDGELARAEVCECKRECKICKGARYVIAKEGPYEVARPCECAGLMARVRLYNDAQIPAGYADKSLVPSGPNDPHGFVHRDIESLKRAKAAVSRYSMSLDVSAGRADATENHSQGLVLMGGYGLGKTHLVCSLLATLTLKRGIACRFVDYYTLLSRIRATFDKGGDRERTGDTEQSLIDPLVEVPVLVIDDLGKGQGSHWELTILDQIVTRRYNAKRIIIATTNYLLEKDLEQPSHQPQGGARRGRRAGESLEERIGERLVSRLHASCDMLLLDGSDYRVTGPRASR